MVTLATPVTPITPEQVEEVKLLLIPNFVIEVVNLLIVDNWQAAAKKSILKQKEIKGQCFLKNKCDAFTWDNSWLDFEPLYRKSGWIVSYDRPAYHESYDAFFTFTKEN